MPHGPRHPQASSLDIGWASMSRGTLSLPSPCTSLKAQPASQGVVCRAHSTERFLLCLGHKLPDRKCPDLQNSALLQAALPGSPGGVPVDTPMGTHGHPSTFPAPPSF